MIRNGEEAKPLLLIMCTTLITQHPEKAGRPAPPISITACLIYNSPSGLNSKLIWPFESRLAGHNPDNGFVPIPNKSNTTAIQRYFGSNKLVLRMVILIQRWLLHVGEALLYQII